MKLTSKVISEKYQNDINNHLEFPRHPISYSVSENAELKEPALLGEHTKEILVELLGYD
jgi:hypothetical protein